MAVGAAARVGFVARGGGSGCVGRKRRIGTAEFFSRHIREDRLEHETSPQGACLRSGGKEAGSDEDPQTT
jgi:hypothetical protein